MKPKSFEDLKIVPQPRIEQSIEVKHKYTDKEKVQLLDEITEADTQLAEAEEAKKAAMAEFKSRIEGIEADRNSVSGRARQGFEMRPT